MHGRSVSPRKCNAMEKQWCGRKQRWKEQVQVQEGYRDVLCLRDCNAAESNNATESSAGERNADAKGLVMFCVSENANAAKSNGVVESSAGRVNADEDASTAISWVVPLIVMTGESDSSVSERVWFPEMLACKALASLWSSGYWLARAAMVAASRSIARQMGLELSPFDAAPVSRGLGSSFDRLPFPCSNGRGLPNLEAGPLSRTSLLVPGSFQLAPNERPLLQLALEYRPSKLGVRQRLVVKGRLDLPIWFRSPDLSPDELPQLEHQDVESIVVKPQWR